MEDLKERILNILRKPQLSGLATVTEDGQPWVRYVVAIADENLVLRCATFIDARKVNQIKQNPEVHLTCGVNSLTEMNPYVQVQGKATVTTDKEARHAFWNPTLAPIFDGPDDPRYAVMEIASYRIEYCTPGSFDPEIWIA